MSYTVTLTRGCRIINGAIPVDDLVALIGAWTDPADKDTEHEWMADTLLSQHFNANMVIGPRHATDAWRAELGLAS